MSWFPDEVKRLEALAERVIRRAAAPIARRMMGPAADEAAGPLR